VLEINKYSKHAVEALKLLFAFKTFGR